jgi:hypothetical protein
MMKVPNALYLMMVVNLVACFVLTYLTLWYFVFVPGAIFGLWLTSRWMNIVYFGITGAVGVVIPIFLSDVSTRLGNASVLAGIIGLPGGFSGPLVITALLGFVLSGIAAVLTSSLRDRSN